jgi:DNA topoisomerase IA
MNQQQRWEQVQRLAKRWSNISLTLHHLHVLSISKAVVEEGVTKPPKFSQEHELILLMDENRIGTDASMAVHVSNIIDRGCVVLCDETGVPLRQRFPQNQCPDRLEDTWCRLRLV